MSERAMAAAYSQNDEFCYRLAKRLDIDGGGENPGDVVKWAISVVIAEMRAESLEKEACALRERISR